jgi:putative peptidoglycan lipid II flippase
VAGGAALIAGVTVAARLMGFARWGVFSSAVGSTATGSAYTAANALPNVLFEVAAGGALAAVAVPLLAGPLAKGALERASATASALMTWTLTVLAPLAAVLALAAEPLARLALSGAAETSGPGVIALATRLIRMFALQVPLYGIGVLAGGVLQAAKRFFWPAVAPLISSVTVIAVYLPFRALAAGAQDDPAALSGAAVGLLGWGTTAGVAALTLPLLAPVFRLGVRWRWTYRFPPGVGRRALTLAVAGIGALLAQQCSVATAVVAAGRVGGAGALPTFNYAQAVYMLPYAVLAVPLATAAFPHLAEWAERGEARRFAAGVAGTTRVVVAVSALGAACLVATAPAVQVLFDRIDRSGDVVGLAAAVTALAPGLIGWGLIAHLQRVLYAAGRAKAAVTACAAGWLTVAAASAGLVWLGGGGPAATVEGLAIAVSAGMSVAGAGLVHQCWRALGRAALAGLARTGLVVLVAAFLGATAGRCAAAALASALGGGLISALASGLAGLALVGAVMLAGVALGDRSLGRALPRAPRPPAP